MSQKEKAPNNLGKKEQKPLLITENFQELKKFCGEGAESSLLAVTLDAVNQPKELKYVLDTKKSIVDYSKCKATNYTLSIEVGNTYELLDRSIMPPSRNDSSSCKADSSSVKRMFSKMYCLIVLFIFIVIYSRLSNIYS